MKNRVLYSVALFLSLIFAIALGELLLRLAGHQPWAYRTIDANEPTTHEPDPVLGWRSEEGSYSQEEDVPYVTVDDNGKTIRHAPERYPETPLRELSVAIRLIEKRIMKSKPRGRYSMRKKATENLLLEMDRLCKTYGAEFIVVMIEGDQTKPLYLTFLQDNHIKTIDCVYEVTPNMKVPGESHPNGIMNSLWAECMANELPKTYFTS